MKEMTEYVQGANSDELMEIKDMIVRLPGRPAAMLVQNLAEIYQTEPRLIVQAVKRNPERFPADFMFRLTRDEASLLKSQNEISKRVSRDTPLAFTREGANMLSAVLRTPAAAEHSVRIMRAFSALERAAEELQHRQGFGQGFMAHQALVKRLSRGGRDMSFIERLLRYRLENGLTQKEAAVLLDCSWDTVKVYEKALKSCGFVFRPVRRRSVSLGPWS